MSDPRSSEGSGGFRSWFASGGYIVFLVILVSIGVFAWAVRPIVEGWGSRAIGDGESVASYGFSLEPLLVPEETLVPAGFARDGLKTLDQPETLPAPLANDKEALGVLRGKYLVPSQRVIGVELGGETRAYPLRVLNHHEVVNDIVGGVPILVVFNPLTELAIVLSREVEGEVLEFGVSGLVSDSHLLLYDRRPEGSAISPSLWSPLHQKAVAGPAAARSARLEVLPSVVEHWGAWVERHPDARVVKPDPRLFKQYRRNPYGAYYGDDRVRFPVSAFPPPGPLPPKARLLVLEAGGAWHALPIEGLEGKASAEAPMVLDFGGTQVSLVQRPDEETLVARDALTGDPLPSFVVFWFAWHAAHPSLPPPHAAS